MEAVTSWYDLLPPQSVCLMTPRYHVYVSSSGNIFMTEIAALIAVSLSDLGYECVFPAPGLPEAGLGRVNVVVAPHEFFPLQAGITEAELLAAAAQSVTVGVEQPGTDWFELGTHYASVSRAVLDISQYAVEELRRRGLPAEHLQLGYHPSWDRWGGDPERPRRRDVAFLGSTAPRRERLLSEYAPLLWNRTTDVRLFEFPRPMSQPRANFVAGEAKWDFLASSRILLNIHRNEVPYFEWVRALEAVVNGAVLVSEVSSDYGPLRPGEHFVAAPAELLGAYAAALLLDPPLRSEISVAAYDFVRTKLEFNLAMAGICEGLDRLATTPAGSGVMPHPLRLNDTPPAPPSQPALQAALETEFVARVRIKELLDSETDAIQTLESLQARLRFGSADHAEVSKTSAWDRCRPDVTVLITSYNYAHFVGEAIESAMASQDLAVEIIVVDDHSQDHSIEVIKAIMDGADWFPIMLLDKAANAGVGAARNLGFAEARADRVLVLDADNIVFPNCLAKLSAALDGEPATSFAYGIIAQIGEPGLISFLPWDVERLVLGNYIDALAMIRKPAWEDLGGYDDYSSQLGWEDYEFWLRMAGDHRGAAFVPEFVACYRIHANSRQTRVNLDTAPLLATFKSRYPFLPWEES